MLQLPLSMRTITVYITHVLSRVLVQFCCFVRSPKHTHTHTHTWRSLWFGCLVLEGLAEKKINKTRYTSNVSREDGLARTAHGQSVDSLSIRWWKLRLWAWFRLGCLWGARAPKTRNSKEKKKICPGSISQRLATIFFSACKEITDATFFFFQNSAPSFSWFGSFRYAEVHKNDWIYLNATVNYIS